MTRAALHERHLLEPVVYLLVVVLCVGDETTRETHTKTRERREESERGRGIVGRKRRQ